MMRMRPRGPAVLAVLAAGLAGGCQTTVQETFGIGKRAPDEFQIVRRQPLIIPPDATLRPPRPGEAGPATQSASSQAREVLTGTADPVPEKRELAKKLGATDVVDALADDAAKQIVELTKGGVDHAIEAVGRPASASLAVASLRRGGTATILGMMPLAEKVGLSAMDLLSGKKLQGAIMGGNRFPVDIPRLVDFEKPPAAARLEAGPPGSHCEASMHFPAGTLQVEAKPGELVTDIFWGEHATAYHVKHRGLVIISSCGHAGIINSIRQIQKTTGIDKVHAVVGGWHLAPSPDEIVARTVEAFKQIDPDYLIPMHCMGFNTMMAIQREMPAKLITPSTGTQVMFGA